METSERQRAFQALIVYAGIVVAALDTALNVIFPSITGHFPELLKAGPTESQAMVRWVIIAFLVPYGVFLPLFGRIGDVYGWRRGVFQSGLLVTTLVFLAMPFAPGFWWLVGMRVIQGIGTALVFSCTAALATNLYDEGRRPIIASRIAAAFPIGSLVGVFLGMLAVGDWKIVWWQDWTIVFWLRSPICLVLLGLSLFLPKQAPVRNRKVDGVGICLLLFSIALLIAAIETLRTGCGWAATCAAISVATLLLFIRHERIAADPVLPPSQFRPHVLIWILAGTGVFFVSFAPLLLISYLATFTGFEKGLLLGAGLLGIPIGSLFLWRPFGILGRHVIGLLGLALLFVGTASAANPFGLKWTALVLFTQGLGVGLFNYVYTDLLLETMDSKDRGVAGSLVGLSRTIGFASCAVILSLMNASEQSLARMQGISDPIKYAFQQVFAYTAELGALVLISLFICGWMLSKADESHA